MTWICDEWRVVTKSSVPTPTYPVLVNIILQFVSNKLQKTTISKETKTLFFCFFVFTKPHIKM